jgi:hypothetical protein
LPQISRLSASKLADIFRNPRQSTQFLEPAMKRLLLLVVALGVIALTGLTVSRKEFSALVDSLVPSSIDLAVEVEPLRNEPNSKYGNITITNLSKETVTIKHVSINRSSEAACSFDPKEASYQSPILAPGLAITVATVAAQAGLCGSIFIVTINTDKGSRDYKFDWTRG